MAVTNRDLVIVRGINDDWKIENFSRLWIGFGSPILEEGNFIALYMSAPISAIRYIAVVNNVTTVADGANYNLKALIELPTDVNPGHGIRKQEYWNINQFNLSEDQIGILHNLVDQWPISVKER